ncbi:alpha-1,2-fucosyltransferase [uncultured Flavobacterium sp.]|uniref:alpha-1,2-fucosyltransferase n=1 Tax=uncultured Flavobacterium sp. TaxID=165435 RepID=UPI00292F3C2A|nr:alpha-1,2-fucosyltransferase [uncultured Flavobacterium sp.]
MDIVIVFNGLGNQMSQYSFFLQKKAINKATYFIPFCKDHNGFELGNVFKINNREAIIQKLLYVLFRILLTDKVKIISSPLKRLLNLLNCKIENESFDYNYNKKFMIPSKGITFYYGGWHTEKYFVESKKTIEEAFEFTAPNDKENIDCIKKINETNSVSIHVRRGDFLNADNINLFGNVCTKEYFAKAIAKMESEISNPIFFVFSNDLEWVKENLVINNVTYVSWNSGINSWKDMYLMCLCKHNIIANSTFSWWGAWLNKNSDKIVLSPSRFLKNDTFTDVYPDSWVKISDY